MAERKGEPRVLKATRSDELGFRDMVNMHSRTLYNHIRRILLNHDDTDDVLQNTFIKAWENMATFRNESDISTWLYRIATNEALQLLRKRKAMDLLTLRFTGVKPPLTYTEVNDESTIERKFEQALRSLTEKQRAVFGMKYFDNMTYRTMSAVLNRSEGTLKAMYHQALMKIEKYLLDND